MIVPKDSADSRPSRLVDVPEHPDQPPQFEPPAFTLYDASHFEVGYGDVCSHDPHLNTDGEALYRFLLENSSRIPFTRVSVKGSHTEHRTRWVTERDDEGRSSQRAETYSENVTDFDFCFDIGPPNDTQPIQWSVSDQEPAYRGTLVRETEQVSLPGLDGTSRVKRKALRMEVKAHKNWAEQRSQLGLPPWSTIDDIDLSDSPAILSPYSATPLPNATWIENLTTIERNPIRSTKNVRDWADEYCASPKYLKEFVFQQELYGWNLAQLEGAIRSAVVSTPYSGNLEVSFTKHRSRIYIRPNNRLSRMLSNKWFKFLSILLLIYPFIWLFKRFHSRGGGKWQVCGAAYPIKRWVPCGEDASPLPPDTDEEGLPQLPAYEANPHPPSSSSSTPTVTKGVYATPSTSSSSRSPNPSSSRFIRTPSGPKMLQGDREGEWFRHWEHTIKRAVMNRYRSSVPLSNPGEAPDRIRVLDGYLDGYVD
ncbi:hypothetical protein BKA70DRAFT_333703 [Coprinopsis sp. MPI-PUGE-AT-0042]|nr:hypothetical protein BKA70DRAFT_333703 [Coprinopsis sp. MPI-PUGE-AT-0042]